MKKEELDFDLVDKLYQNLILTSKIVGRLFIIFFTLMLLLSALVFEPELFSTNPQPTQLNLENRLPAKELSSQDTLKVDSRLDKLRARPEPIVPLFGFKITQNIILKYSPLILAAIYLMLVIYLIYLDFIKKEYFETYENLYTQAEGKGESSLLYKIRLPNLHYILTDLSLQHTSKFVQFIYQTADVAKSLVLYVLPMVIVIILLGEGVQRASSNGLIAIFYMSPVLVIIGALALTWDWFIEAGLVFRYFLAIVRTKTLKKVETLGFARTLLILIAVSLTLAGGTFAVNQFLKSTDYLSVEKAETMVKEKGFYHTYWNENGVGIKHQYELETINEDTIVIDQNTNLTWQKAGLDNEVNYDGVEAYIQKLRSDKFAGFDDWRLPTLVEAMSLMEPVQKNEGQFIDSIFDSQQGYIWTSDKRTSLFAWIVQFFEADCYEFPIFMNLHVRAVR